MAFVMLAMRNANPPTFREEPIFTAYIKRGGNRNSA